MPQPKLASFRKRLGRKFFSAPTADVAQHLLGNYLMRRLENGTWLGGKIVETEAYLATEDPASHSYRGMTRRNAAMFSPPGVIYVYTIHAKHCLNFSTERDGVGAAVLIRAIEPIWGIEEMCQHRGKSDAKKLAGGPAMLCQALAIDLTFNFLDLENVDWFAIIPGEPLLATEIISTARIGISRATEMPLRFVVANSKFLSRPAKKYVPSEIADAKIASGVPTKK